MENIKGHREGMENLDGMLLPLDFDMDDYPLYRRSKSWEEEESPDQDPADKFDIFPSLLARESQFYPRSWGELYERK